MPLSIKRRVTLDLSRTGYQVTIPFMKSDRVAHEVYITVKDGTEPVILPPGTMAAITVFNGVEGGVVDNLVVDHVNNVLMYVPSPNALAVAGNVKCTLTLFDELGAVIAAPSMIFGVMNSDTEETEAEIQAALEANPSWGLIVTAAQSAESAKASSNEASQAAVEAYAAEVKAKLYSEAAQASEAKANMYKTDALGYRNVAELKATEAANSAAAAKTSEESARADAASVVGARAEINAEINEVRETANEAKAIASGATQALTDRNYADLTERLLAAQRYEFNVGQNFLVETPDVPDVWVVGYGNEPRDFIYRTDADFEAQLMAGGLQIGYVIIAPLESAKVDLTEYAKTQLVNRELSKLEERTNVKIGEITDKVSKNAGDITATNARVATAENNIVSNAQRITASESDISALASRTAAVESKAIRNDKRLTNLEAGIPDDDFITDDSTAYVRDVPTNALPFAEITEIGGMTYKEGNVLRSAPTTEVVSEGVNLIDLKDEKIAGNYAWDRPITVTEGKYWISVFNSDGTTDGWLRANNYAGFFLRDDVYVVENIEYGRTVTKEQAAQINKVRVNISPDRYTGTAATLAVMLNKGTTAQPYRPYIKRSLAIPETVQALPDYGVGIPNTDYYNRIRWRYDEATDKWVREYDRPMKTTNLGTLNWQYGNLFDTGVYCFYAEGATDANNEGTYSIANILCHLYDATTANEIAQRGTTGIALYEKLIVIRDTNYTDAATFKTAMSGGMLVYELATPEITDISHLLPEDNLIGVEGGGSMTPVNEFGYDVPMTVRYRVDTEVI